MERKYKTEIPMGFIIGKFIQLEIEEEPIIVCGDIPGHAELARGYFLRQGVQFKEDYWGPCASGNCYQILGGGEIWIPRRDPPVFIVYDCSGSYGAPDVKHLDRLMKRNPGLTAVRDINGECKREWYKFKH